MTTVNIYLTFNGNCEDAFNFYKSIFGGEFTYIGRFKDMPAEEGQPPMPDSDKDLIMHVGLPISREALLMGSDVGSEWGKNFVQGNNFSISVGADSKNEVERIFKGLSDGGQITMPLNETFWSPYFGMLTDKFGVNWMIGLETDEK